MRSTCFLMAFIAVATVESLAAQTWMTQVDYPAKALREGREGTSYFTVTVGKDGRAKDCTITQSSGHTDLDEQSCRMIVRQARWEPAVDEAGNPVEASYSSKVNWTIPR